ncbi:MAG: hypothetical protein LIP23_03885 [Planctomycetes bacterium]|nr:hypothetical protein [Planctomycetota bacterium]
MVGQIVMTLREATAAVGSESEMPAGADEMIHNTTDEGRADSPALPPPPTLAPIVRERLDGYQVLRRDDGRDYWSLVRQFQNNQLHAIKLPTNRRIPERSAYLVEAWGKKFVFKREAAPIRKFETAMSALIHGPFYSRLMLDVDRALRQGCDFIQNIYLVAEKINGRVAQETFIILEYLEGKTLKAVPDEKVFYPEVGKTLDRLHAYRLALVDTNTGNIIYSDGRLKIIDLSNKSWYRIGRAKDVARFKYVFGIVLDPGGMLDRLLVALFSLHYRALVAMRRFKRNRLKRQSTRTKI